MNLEKAAKTISLEKAAETLVKPTTIRSFSFGNGILYDMCSSPSTDLSNPVHLADMIWLIGRAYAASPERRTYGYVREDGKLKKNSDNKRKPLWPAKKENDGKGVYFISIAENMTKHPEFDNLLNIVNDLKGSTYKFDNSDCDVASLSDGIYAVHLYNQLIRNASEEFDGLNASDDPDAIKAKKAGARCKNQISFCSKFLHFCCPGIVFIIDQYSLEGGKRVIPGREPSYVPKFENDSKKSDPPPDLESVNPKGNYNDVLKDNYNDVLEKVTYKLKAKALDSNLFENDTTSDEEEKIRSYVEHCTRAYCVAKYLNETKSQHDLTKMPRLIDDLFLRVKK